MKDQENEKYQDSAIQTLNSEIEDCKTSNVIYEVLTYPADFTLEGLVNKYKKDQLIIPGFQRKYVWSIAQASKLIESFLLGLPVPAIFLYTNEKDELNVIDGQQRLLSVVYYFSGYFGEEKSGKQTVFKLIGINEKSPYFEKTYKELQNSNTSAYNRLNDAVLRAFVVKQIDPKDNTSIFHIFERLNTGGTQLVGQEVRNCIYQGKFNDMLKELNKNENWRKIFGSKTANKRQRDIELILRFFALLKKRNKYEKPMKDFLSDFMADNKDLEENEISKLKNTFNNCCEIVINLLGKNPFHILKGINVAVFDSVFTLTAENVDQIPNDLRNRFETLKKDQTFLKLVTSATTDKNTIKDRFDKCYEILFK